MAIRSKDQAHLAAKGGAIAGIAGGVVISLFMLATNVAAGRDVWMGMKGAGAPFLGERAMQPGFDAAAVIVGVLSHFAVSIGWGILFGLLFFGLSKGLTMIAGVFWGLVVWIVMFYVVLPVLGLGDMARSAPVGMAILEHVLFGIATAAAFLPYQRELPGSVMTGTPRPTH
jgi:hypothetical protein